MKLSRIIYVSQKDLDLWKASFEILSFLEVAHKNRCRSLKIILTLSIWVGHFLLHLLVFGTTPFDISMIMVIFLNIMFVRRLEKDRVFASTKATQETRSLLSDILVDAKRKEVSIYDVGTSPWDAKKYTICRKV